MSRVQIQSTPRSLSRIAAGALAITALLGLGCGPSSETPAPKAAPAPTVAVGPDPHSFARPDEIAVRHLELDLEVDFESRRLTGTATLTLDRRRGGSELYLDTRDLDIHRVTAGLEGPELAFELGPDVPILGRRLAIPVSPDLESVHIEYSSRPEAAALQWLPPSQTGGDHPFLFSQSQAILARTWIPCQDTPAVRVTYDATLRVPPGLMALMSAENPTAIEPSGVYRFTMPQAIPSYLLAVAVGELEFRALGERTGVFAAPGVVDAAAWEFEPVDRMMEVAEELYGPYRWGRFDILVLPPSFPFGGMENPRLTFATPTILAGDRSLVSLVAHELAHSWSGNLVTNATWNDFWLNEGFTSYIEYRLMERLESPGYADMLRSLGRQEVDRELDELGADSPDTRLAVDLGGRSPDDGATSCAYDKGAALLQRLEETVGRDEWDAFLRAYFARFAFRSLDTETFLATLDEMLGETLAAAEDAPDLEAWIRQPGLPADAPQPRPAAFDAVEAELAAWLAGRAATDLATADWSTHQWRHFIQQLPDNLDPDRLAELDAAFALSGPRNAEILAAWFEVSAQQGHTAVYPRLEEFLLTVGRLKFLRPLYTALAATPEGLDQARDIYRRARPGYHPVTVGALDKILEWEEDGD